MDMQSKAKKLIEMIQTAPVEWKPLGEVVPISRGKRLVRSQLQDSGQYPVYQNSLQPLGFYDDQNCRAYMTFVIAAGAAGEIGFSDIEFWAADDCYYFDCPKEILHDKFLYYFLLSERHQLTSQIRKASVPRLGRGSIEKIKIPIPSLEIQQKIVKILDKFTELEATLEAELALRKRQYRYYRDFILDFDNQIGGGIVDSYKRRLKDVVWKTLGEVVNIKNGKDWKNFSSGDIPVYGSGGVMGYVDTFAYDKPSVLIPRKGSITNIFYMDFPFWNVDTIYYTEIDTSKLKPKFFYYFMRTIDLMALDTGSGRPSLTQTILNKIKIPIPPLPEQEKIVAILDKFDTLTHSISEGLPHEIALRRKQYEYYREQLLAFPKAA
ncbi:restriction endonuclease subunit S [Eikenella corrodens]|uniref:Restriction endonuclease subunit S n=1 Tax=Eikenella corrodens TaxID=539 RepID=A0A3S9SKM0_EIKCO|nr:restriction endonuclease subunit S [Eikenella corrodens]AZR60076.1 restriction endonuclease subunit S [Eikenella corrodens]